MEKYNPVGWFEVPVEDLDRAEKFYETMLNIKLDRQPEQGGMTMSWFPMDQNAKGAAGSLAKHSSYGVAKDVTGVVVYFTAPDFDDALLRAEEAGGTILIPKKDIGEYGYVAWLKDTEGNTIALHTAK